MKAEECLFFLFRECLAIQQAKGKWLLALLQQFVALPHMFFCATTKNTCATAKVHMHYSTKHMWYHMLSLQYCTGKVCGTALEVCAAAQSILIHRNSGFRGVGVPFNRKLGSKISKKIFETWRRCNFSSCIFLAVDCS